MGSAQMVSGLKLHTKLTRGPQTTDNYDKRHKNQSKIHENQWQRQMLLQARACAPTDGMESIAHSRAARRTATVRKEDDGDCADIVYSDHDHDLSS